MCGLSPKLRWSKWEKEGADGSHGFDRLRLPRWSGLEGGQTVGAGCRRSSAQAVGAVNDGNKTDVSVFAMMSKLSGHPVSLPRFKGPGAWGGIERNAIQ